jgi:hypothetical protein
MASAAPQLSDRRVATFGSRPAPSSPSPSSPSSQATGVAHQVLKMVREDLVTSAVSPTCPTA